MPQMAPMSWLILFLLSSFPLHLFTMLNSSLMLQSDSTDSTSPSLNWKW